MLQKQIRVISSQKIFQGPELGSQSGDRNQGRIPVQTIGRIVSTIKFSILIHRKYFEEIICWVVDYPPPAMSKTTWMKA